MKIKINFIWITQLLLRSYKYQTLVTAPATLSFNSAYQKAEERCSFSIQPPDWPNLMTTGLRMHCSAKLLSPPLSILFFCLKSFTTNRKYSFVFTKSECHLTIKTLILGLKWTMFCYKWSRLTVGERSTRSVRDDCRFFERWLKVLCLYILTRIVYI